MTNQQHWHPEDIDDALVADFDGSLSGLCIMSLSFDFTRNTSAVAAAAAAAAAVSATSPPGVHLQTSAGQLQAITTGCSGASSQATSGTQEAAIHQDHEHHSESSFKRFKASNGASDEVPQLMQSNNSKIARQLQKLKSCLNAAAASNPLAAHLSAITQATASESHRSSPEPSEDAQGDQEEVDEVSSESSRCSSTADAHSPRSPTPTSTLSSNTCSTSSSRQLSPAPPATNHQQDASDKCLTVAICERSPSVINGSKTKTTSAASASTPVASTSSDKQISVYSVKDSLMNNQGSTLKESSYTTSVITTSAPMPHTFKSIHHPFHSFKQFPLSPYQFSNSSINQHDFYDRYLSQHDSHQPLQTPLIGIERTQDLLSLKLPPHGPEEFDPTGGHRFGSTKPDWMFGEPETPAPNIKDAEQNDTTSRKVTEDPQQVEPIFPNFSSINTSKSKSPGQREPIDLNVSYPISESLGFNASKRSSSASFKSQLFSQISKSNSSQRQSPRQEEVEPVEPEEERDNASQMGLESMFGVDASKQKFQYVLAAPISVATKLSEDTMTYLNQGQAYEIKLENLTDVAVAKKGFMCSIINIGFQERHMQQAENELWQQWSQQHPNEKIFSVDMKLSYNVFGVESDGLNKYEFLWDSSKVAGVFIRINSISTEFTPKKHGGEKGVPFKLSIETFSYNSKTHDSYFISAACCQIKVFKPKGAERKIRSDRDKISRRPIQEQDKYHGARDYSIFHECTLASLHPMADSSLCYYRHSHGHFASKQVVTAMSNATGSGSLNNAPLQASNQHSDDDLEATPNKHLSSPTIGNSPPQNHCETTTNNQRVPPTSIAHIEQPRELHDLSRCISNNGSKSYPHLNYSASRLMHPQSHYGNRAPETIPHPSDYSTYPGQQPNMETTPTSFNTFTELTPLQQPNAFNHHHHHHHHQMYHNNQAVRNHHHPTINSHPSHFNMAYHYGHPPPPLSQPVHLSSSSMTGSGVYDSSTPSMQNTLTTIAYGSNHFPIHQHPQISNKSSLYHRYQPIPGNDTTKPSSIQPIGPPPPVNSSFRASNLALTAHSHNVSSYTPQTSNNSNNDTSASQHHPTEGSYSFVHSYHQQLASATSDTVPHSLTSLNPNELPAAGPNKQVRTISSEPYYSSSNIGNNRHQSDGYLSSGGGSLPDTASTPSSGGGSSTETAPASAAATAVALHWMHSSPVHHSSQPSGSVNGTICRVPTQRGLTPSHNDSHIYNNTSTGAGHNQFECTTQTNTNNNNYDSDHNSPQHENQHTSDSSSSCQSRFKNSSLILPPSFNGSNNNLQDSTRLHPTQQTTNFQITANSTCTEVKSWLGANRFSLLVKTFSNFSGSDLLRLSKTDLIEICGVIDGIRLFNNLHISQPIKHIFCDQNVSLDYHHT